MRGLIAAALGGLSKGVGQVATAQIEINARKALMEAEEEMRARLAEAAEGRDEKRQIAAEGRAETQQIAAEGRAISNIPLTAEATARAEEATMARRFGEGSKYPGLLGSEMTAMETPAQRATRKAAESESSWENETRDLRRKLAAAKTEEERDDYARQLDALTGGTARLDPLVAAELEDLQYQTRRATVDYEKAVSDYDPDAKAAASETLDNLRAQKERLFRRTANTGGAGEPRITTDEEYDALPSGTVFIDPTGTRRTKP